MTNAIKTLGLVLIYASACDSGESRPSANGDSAVQTPDAGLDRGVSPIDRDGGADAADAEAESRLDRGLPDSGSLDCTAGPLTGTWAVRLADGRASWMGLRLTEVEGGAQEIAATWMASSSNRFQQLGCEPCPANRLIVSDNGGRCQAVGWGATGPAHSAYDVPPMSGPEVCSIVGRREQWFSLEFSDTASLEGRFGEVFWDGDLSNCSGLPTLNEAERIEELEYLSFCSPGDCLRVEMIGRRLQPASADCDPSGTWWIQSDAEQWYPAYDPLRIQSVVVSVSGDQASVADYDRSFSECDCLPRPIDFDPASCTLSLFLPLGAYDGQGPPGPISYPHPQFCSAVRLQRVDLNFRGPNASAILWAPGGTCHDDVPVVTEPIIEEPLWRVVDPPPPPEDNHP